MFIGSVPIRRGVRGTEKLGAWGSRAEVARGRRDGTRRGALLRYSAPDLSSSVELIPQCHQLCSKTCGSGNSLPNTVFQTHCGGLYYEYLVKYGFT